MDANQLTNEILVIDRELYLETREKIKIIGRYSAKHPRYQFMMATMSCEPWKDNIPGTHRYLVEFRSPTDSKVYILALCNWAIREGDSVIVHSIDRLARNLSDLKVLVAEFNLPSIKPNMRD